ncbi:MAG: hypothetical protein Q9N34_00590 [Aquificota bacterium]|nr:hypothetical protein [Aquificota bacterium]
MDHITVRVVKSVKKVKIPESMLKPPEGYKPMSMMWGPMMMCRRAEKKVNNKFFKEGRL